MGNSITYEHVKGHSKPYSSKELWKTLETYRLMVTPIVILVSVLLAGVAAGFGAWNSTIQLTMAIAPAVAVLVFSINQMPIRLIIGTFALSIILDLILLAI